jgi:phosphonopyruvate decarboxylase
MLTPKYLFDLLKGQSADFFAGVPDSLLKEFCAYVTDNSPPTQHIISANEGSAIALAAGHFLATGNIPVVYMQNSGLGNAINPLLSLTDADVYSIPVLLMIGWRGEPGGKDEPQHVKQGKVTTDILKAIGIPYCVLSSDEGESRGQIVQAYQYLREFQAPYAIVLRKETFSAYTLQHSASNNYELSREDAIQAVVDSTGPTDIIVSSTGMISRELYEYRAATSQGHKNDFLTVGSMGHASQIALSIALQKPERTVYCFDGDGALLMHMGALATIGSLKPRNLVHIVLNNGAHDSVGGQPTVGFLIEITKIAEACGYERALVVHSKEGLDKAIALCGGGQLSLLEIRVKRGARADLGRPKTTPIANKEELMLELRMT